MSDLANLLTELADTLGVEPKALHKRVLETLVAPRLDARIALDLCDAAAAISISRRSLENAIARGAPLRIVRIGSRRLVSVDSLREYVAAGGDSAQPAAGDRASVGSAETSANKQSVTVSEAREGDRSGA